MLVSVTDATSTSGDCSPSRTALKPSFGCVQVAGCEEVLAARILSKMPQLYATPQDVMIASVAHEPPRCGKS